MNSKQAKYLDLILKTHTIVSGSLNEWERNILRGMPLDNIGLETIANVLESLAHMMLDLAKEIRNDSK